MDYLSQVSEGKQEAPMFITLMGTPKVGKTTFAAGAPTPIILDIENGSSQINVKRISPPKIQNFRDIIGTLQQLATDQHPYKTVVIDSLDHLETWVWKSVCTREGKSSIEKVGGGWQKGYVEALAEWQEIIFLLEKCRIEKGMNVICIAHTRTKSVSDPTQAMNYDKFELKVNDRAAALFKEKSDAILFARQEVNVMKSDLKGGKSIGIDTGKRFLYTQGRAGHEGGNRYGLPYEMELDFKVFMEHVKKGVPLDPKVLAEQIKGLIPKVKDEPTKKKVEEALTKAAADAPALIKILDKLETLTAA